ncbi:MAG: YIP1 family protein [Gemmatimonadaceae bacterium]|nr:YIP1 family protein [Gemmatimonadaceae bacterium]
MTAPDTIESPPPAPTEAPGALDDLIEIFVAPATVFARRANASAWLPILIATIVITGLAIVGKDAMAPIFDAEFSRGIAAAQKQNPQLTAENFEGMRKFGTFTSTYGLVAFLPLSALLVGLWVWIVAKLFSAPITYGQGILIAGWSMMPRILGTVIDLAQLMLIDAATITGRFSLSLGVGRFLDPDTQQVLMAVLGRVDLITLWVTAIIAVGIVTVGKLDRSKVWLIGAVSWIGGMLFPLFGALRAG